MKFEFDGRRRACVFFKSHSVLVNGFPAVEINIYKCLKQGDPLAPFLFLLVIEGLSDFMKKISFNWCL